MGPVSSKWHGLMSREKQTKLQLIPIFVTPRKWELPVSPLARLKTTN